MGRSQWDDYDSYREDEDTYVYDQGCFNCGNPFCPMELPETAEEHYEQYGTLEDFDEEEAERRFEEVMKLRKEDAESRDDEPVWCIYWQKKREYRGSR